MITKQIKITCRFCKKETGHIDIPDIKAMLNERLEELKSIIAMHQERISNLSDENQTQKTYETKQSNKIIVRTQVDVATIKQEIASLPAVDPMEASAVKDIVDSRCDACEAYHGSLKEMEVLYQSEFGDNHENFIKEMKKHGFKKTPAFVAEIEKKKTERMDRELKESIKRQKTEAKAGEYN